MKLNVVKRMLIALMGLILLALSVCMALEALQVLPLVTELSLILVGRTPKRIAFTALVCVVTAAFGVFGLSMLIPRGRKKRGFIVQKTEHGEIDITVKSIEGLVYKCAQLYEELKVLSVAVEEVRDGLLIKLRVTLPGGTNIPLAIGALQKQVKQYVTACSGMDVSEVRVKVDSSDQSAGDSPYAVQEAAAALPVEAPQLASIPREAAMTVELPKAEPLPDVPEATPERPTHQRLFSAVDEPAIVPVPPELAETPVEEADAEAEEAQPVADHAEETAKQASPLMAEQTENTACEAQTTENTDAGEEAAQLSEDEMNGQQAETLQEAEADVWDAQAAQAEAEADAWDAEAARVDAEEARLEADVARVHREAMEAMAEERQKEALELLTPHDGDTEDDPAD